MVPLTLHLGLLEWVPGTTPMKAMINDQLEIQSNKTQSLTGSFQEYVAGLIKVAGEKKGERLPETIKRLILKGQSANAAVKRNFLAQSQRIPEHLLLSGMSLMELFSSLSLSLSLSLYVCMYVVWVE